MIIKRCASLFTNEDGFTMLEMVYSFLIFCIIATLIPQIIQFTIALTPIKYDQSHEWNVFTQQIKKEIRTVDNISVINNVLILQDGSNVITYEQYDDKLRRRVNRTGHEVLLQGVKQSEFEQLKNGVKLTVIAIDNYNYEVIFRPYLTVEGLSYD